MQFLPRHKTIQVALRIKRLTMSSPLEAMVLLLNVDFGWPVIVPLPLDPTNIIYYLQTIFVFSPTLCILCSSKSKYIN